MCVDTSQVFATGFSYGGAMSYAIACARATVFRAVAVPSGATLSGCTGGTQPIACLGIHGVRDGTLAISNGRSLRDRFVRNNGCTAQNPAEPAQGSLTHIVTTCSGCASGHPLVGAAVDEGHIAAPQDGATGGSGSRTWVPQLVWNFFSQFSSSPPPTITPTSPAPTSPVPTTPQPTTTNPTPGGATCRVAATVNAWNSGLTETLSLTNTGGTAINGWSLAFTLPAGQSISSGWNATFASGSGTTPASFTLNGASCARAWGAVAGAVRPTPTDAIGEVQS